MPTDSPSSKKWLIIEDALRDLKGHWYEYIRTFSVALSNLGDRVTILCDTNASKAIVDDLDALPILPTSIWHRMGDSAGILRRYLRVPFHALATFLALRRFLKKQPDWDVFFIPTVMVHHLLGWYLLLSLLPKTKTRILFFFPNLPISVTDSAPVWASSPTVKLLCWLLRQLAPDIGSGRVIIGVETLEMRNAFEYLTQLPATYFPHPVEPLQDATLVYTEAGTRLFACYGQGRPEKGTDILQQAIASVLHDGSCSPPPRFAFQWISDFKDSDGRTISLLPSLEHDPHVDVIRDYFRDNEYPSRLGRTSLMLLPYRHSSYALRVSRVIIEAMVNGIPTITTEKTTLASQADQFGATIVCADGSIDSLKHAIVSASNQLPVLAEKARERMNLAREHFSVSHFRSILFPEAA